MSKYDIKTMTKKEAIRLAKRFNYAVKCEGRWFRIFYETDWGMWNYRPCVSKKKADEDVKEARDFMIRGLTDNVFDSD